MTIQECRQRMEWFLVS